MKDCLKRCIWLGMLILEPVLREKNKKIILSYFSLAMYVLSTLTCSLFSVSSKKFSVSSRRRANGVGILVFRCCGYDHYTFLSSLNECSLK